MSQEWYSRKESAKYLGVSPDTIDRLRQAGRLATYRNPETGAVRLRKSELDEVFVREETNGLPELSYRAS
jgi:excisionase family DNA binding protein